MSECRHLNTVIFRSNHLGCGQCYDCNEEVELTVVFNNWLLEFQRLKQELEGNAKEKK